MLILSCNLTLKIGDRDLSILRCYPNYATRSIIQSSMPKIKEQLLHLIKKHIYPHYVQVVRDGIDSLNEIYMSEGE